MRGKRLVCWMLVFGLIFYLSGFAAAVDCNCSGCADCMTDLGNASCTTVYLTVSIVDYSGGCISNPAGFENKIFDCQGNTIDGNDVDDGGTDYGIYLMDKSDNIIMNCIITDFLWGVYILGSSRNDIINNTLSSNYRGLVIQSSNNMIVGSNDIVNNTWDGVNLRDTSSYNTLVNNTIENNGGDGGIVFNSQLASSEPRANIISDNTISNNNDGIIFWATCNATECDSAGENNTFVNNDISNNSGVGINMTCVDSGGSYCAANASSFNVNFNNSFMNNTIEDNRDGIALTYANGTDIYANTVCGNSAVDIDNSSSDPFSAGDDNTCNNTLNWNDLGATGCTDPCIADGDSDISMGDITLDSDNVSAGSNVSAWFDVDSNVNQTLSVRVLANGTNYWNRSVNVTDAGSTLVNVTFNTSVLSAGDYILNFTLYNSSGSFMEWNGELLTIFAGNSCQFTLSKSLLTSGSIYIGNMTLFLINITNTGSSNITNLSIVDNYDVDFNYSAASLIPSSVDYDSRLITWANSSVNLTAGSSYTIYVNLSAIISAPAVSNVVNVSAYDSLGNTSSDSTSMQITILGEITSYLSTLSLGWNLISLPLS